MHLWFTRFFPLPFSAFSPFLSFFVRVTVKHKSWKRSKRFGRQRPGRRKTHKPWLRWFRLMSVAGLALRSWSLWPIPVFASQRSLVRGEFLQTISHRTNAASSSIGMLRNSYASSIVSLRTRRGGKTMNSWLVNTLLADTPANTSTNRCGQSCFLSVLVVARNMLKLYHIHPAAIFLPGPLG